MRPDKCYIYTKIVTVAGSQSQKGNFEFFRILFKGRCLNLDCKFECCSTVLILTLISDRIFNGQNDTLN